jgi:16S rRNA (guanine966-N2)-methyltransferase
VRTKSSKQGAGRPKLRIVGGALAGRRFGRAIGESTRPTSDRVREGIASALSSRDAFAGARVLDLYAGTGALAFEALSRGAERALLVEADAAAARAIEESARELGVERRAKVLAVSVGAGAHARIAREGPFDLVFADPPYDAARSVAGVLDSLAAAGALADDGWLVLEYRRGDRPGVGPYEVVSDYRYGDTEVILARRPRRAEGPTEQS